MIIVVTWRFRSQRTFFGLNGDYIKDVYEQFFLMKYYGGWSFTEAYNLPISIRRWFLDRLSKQLNTERENMENSYRKASNQAKSSKGHSFTS